MPAPSRHPQPLYVRLHNWIGDVVVGVPALRLLTEAGVAVECVGRGWAPALLAGHGWPVHVLPSGLRARARFWRGLRSRQSRAAGAPDALLLATSFSAALECRLAGVRTLGFATDHRGWLLAGALPRPEGCHAVEEYWRLACAYLGIDRPPPADLGLAVAPAAAQAAQALRASHGLAGAYAVLCPFATGTMAGRSKRWPHFAELARTLHDDGLPLLLCPGPGEEDEARRDFPGAIVLDKVPLDVYAALLRDAALVVANDTGPGHIAAAVGAPLVSVLGVTDAARWAPWGSRVTVVQQPGGWPTLEAVRAAVSSVLAV